MSPIYSFTCEKCHESEDHLFTLANRPDFISCSKCQGPAQFKISGGHFIVEGANANNNYSGESNFKWIGDDSRPTKK